VKVGDQLCEFILGFLLEGVYAMCGDDEGSVVCVGVDCGLYCFYDIVNEKRKNVVESVLPCGIPSVIICVCDWAC